MHLSDKIQIPSDKVGNLTMDANASPHGGPKWKQMLGRTFNFKPKMDDSEINGMSKFGNLIDLNWISKMYPKENFEGISIGEFKNLKLFRDGIDPNLFFDSDWYLKEYADVNKAEIDPLWHYVMFGEIEGRRPNPFFDPFFYSSRHPDLDLWSDSLLRHYLEHGHIERRISCDFGTLESIAGAVELAKRNVASARSLLGQNKVDIIIPVFNEWTFTERCIRAIQSTLDFELVNVCVLDDSSTDQTSSEIQRYPFVTVIKTPQNLGFTRACNFAFENFVESQFVYLLNNDTEPVSGFIINALQTMYEDDSAGVVGSRLLYSDSTLQESGGIVFKDGSAANYGRGGDPDNTKFRATRKVDYCSGAAILIRGSFLRKIGGFDEIFAPAYYEDTDLAFQSRKAGFNTYVSAESNVIHHEGKSHGVNLTDEGKSHQSKNASKFFKKWEQELAKHFPPNSEALDKAAQRLNTRKVNILWIDVDAPDPSRDSGSVRTMALLRIALGLDCKIVFVSKFGTKTASAAYLRNIGINVCDSLDEASQVFDSYIDLVWISRLPMMQEHFSSIRMQFPGSKIVFDTVDLHGLREIRGHKIANSNEAQLHEASRLLRQEVNFCQMSDVTVVVSQAEIEILASFGTSQTTRIISNVHEPELFMPKYEETKGIVFVGGFNHPPNVSAVKWFVEFVWPLLPVSIRKDGFSIVGSNIPDDLISMENDEIQPIGWVNDSVATVQKHRLSVAPLLYGAGVKGKVGEAFSSGVPVVLTDVAAEGMGITHLKHAMIANEASDFANAIEKIYTDDLLWSSVQASAVDLVNEKFSVTRACQEFSTLIDDLITQITI